MRYIFLVLVMEQGTFEKGFEFAAVEERVGDEE